MMIDKKREDNRTTVSWKINDVINQLNEIEDIVSELELSSSDENFLNNINSLRTNLQFYFSQWKRGRRDEN